MLDSLKGLQSALVGFLGFSGVMVTLWWNARLARLGREAAAEQERRSLRTALVEELRHFSFYLKAAVMLVDKQEGGAIMPTFSARIFDESVSKIGLLTQTEVASIVRTYNLLDALKKLSNYPEAGGRWSIDAGVADYFIKAGNDIISQMDEAIGLLGDNVPVGKPGSRRRPDPV
jgi:hypothetical protein